MSSTTIFTIALVVAGVLAGLAVFTIAARRPKSTAATGRLDRKTLKRDAEARKEREAAGAVAVMTETETETETADAVVSPPPAPVDPLTTREVVTPEEMGVTRRSFFNRALLGIFGVFLAQFALAGLAFFWPKLSGGFGAPINVGNIDDLRLQILQPDGSIVPFFMAEAQSWLVPFPESEIAGSSFEGLPVVVGATADEPGLMALWQRCVHLGCRVPSCVPSQGFECPCHGSRYNFHGEYEAGPAPRNMDRFVVELDDSGNVIVQTGSVIPTPRAKNKTIQYPQGPSCG